MSRHDVRYSFEHEILPHLFFSNTKDFVITLLTHNTILYNIIDDVFNDEGLENPYAESDFRVLADKPTDEIFAIQIVFPEPEDEPLCYSSYLFFDEQFEKLGFYCIERDESGFKPFLCAWTAEGTHCNFGNCTLDDAKNYTRCLDFYIKHRLGIKKNTCVEPNGMGDTYPEEIIRLIEENLPKDDTKTKYSAEIADIIENYMKHEDLDYCFNEEEGTFLLEVKSSGKHESVMMFIRVNSSDYYVKVWTDSIAADANDGNMMAKIAEFIARANFYCKTSRLTLDYDFEKGRIECRVFRFCEDALPSEQVVKDSIQTAFSDFEGYAPGLMKIICNSANVDVKTVFNECESSF